MNPTPLATSPRRLTLAQAYAALHTSTIGGAIGIVLDGGDASGYGFAGRDEIVHHLRTSYNIEVIDDGNPPSPATAILPDEDGWSLAVDHHHQQRGAFGASTVRAVNLTARKDGATIASASKPMNPSNRLNGLDVTHAARKLQRKLAKLGFSTIGDTLNIAGFRSLNRAAS